MKSNKVKKVGIKKYVIMACFYGLMIFYCIDENLSLSLWIAVVQFLMIIMAGMIRRGTFPSARVYDNANLPGWLLAISLIMIVPFGLANDYDSTRNYVQRNTQQTFVWPNSGLALELPEPITNSGRIYTNNELEFQVDMYNVSRTRFGSYIKACKRKGFDDVNYEFDNSFSALNKEGFDLYCWLDDHGEMSLTLRSPKKLSRIDWPDNELLELLPEPENLYGRIDADRSGYAAVCLGNVWDNVFKEYTASCREAGFRKNYERRSDMYQANDEEGNLLLLDYDTNMHVMYIQIWSAEEIAKNEASTEEEIDLYEASDEETDDQTETGTSGSDVSDKEDAGSENTVNKRGTDKTDTENAGTEESDTEADDEDTAD